MTKNIAHFLNLSNSFFQVVCRKRVAPMLHIERPILLICVSLLISSQHDNMELFEWPTPEHYIRFTDALLTFWLTFTSTVKGGTWAFSARPTITSSRGSHSLWLQTGHSCSTGSVTWSAASWDCAAAALEVLCKALCTHPVTDRPSWGGEMDHKLFNFLQHKKGLWFCEITVYWERLLYKIGLFLNKSNRPFQAKYGINILIQSVY